MKKFICAVLALVMVLSLAACGSKQDDNSGKTDVDLTAQEVLDKLKETLGDSYGCGRGFRVPSATGCWA